MDFHRPQVKALAMNSVYAFITFVGDGTNWQIIATGGTVT